MMGMFCYKNLIYLKIIQCNNVFLSTKKTKSVLLEADSTELAKRVSMKCKLFLKTT